MSQSLDLLFLGSGNAFASGRYWSSFLLNGRYLFDASPVALPHLKRTGTALEEIEAIFISHFHGDHFLGLPFLLLEYAEHTARTKELTILGPPGIEERVRVVMDACYPHVFQKEAGYKVTYIDVEDGLTGQVAGAKFIARSVTHVDELDCFGYRLETGGRIAAYSGDSMMCDALVDLASGADVFVVECSCWQETCGPHLGPGDLRELRRQLGPEPTFILTHLDAGKENLGIENTLVADDLARFHM